MTLVVFNNMSFTSSGLDHVMRSPHFIESMDLNGIEKLPSVHWSFLEFRQNALGVNQVTRGPHYSMSYVFTDELQRHSGARLFQIGRGLVLVYLAAYLNFDEKTEYEFDFNKEIFIYEKLLLNHEV